MKYTFNNRLLACAFAGAALGLNKGSRWEYDCDNQADNFLEIPGTGGPVTIEINLEDEFFHLATGIRDKDTPTITTLAQLEAALGTVRAAVSRSPGEGAAFSMGEYDDNNEIGYSFTINKDGSVEVGCQNYSPQEADQLVALATAYLKSGRLRPATTIGSFKVSVCDPAGKVLAINDGQIKAKHILTLEALRRKYTTATQPSAKASPVRLFGPARAGRTRKTRKK